jgi:hypothetical protein
MRISGGWEIENPDRNINVTYHQNVLRESLWKLPGTSRWARRMQCSQGSNGFDRLKQKEFVEIATLLKLDERPHSVRNDHHYFVIGRVFTSVARISYISVQTAKCTMHICFLTEEVILCTKCNYRYCAFHSKFPSRVLSIVRAQSHRQSFNTKNKTKSKERTHPLGFSAKTGN